MKLTCQFPRAASVPVRFLPGVSGSDLRLLTVRGTVASVEPEGTATLTGCVGQRPRQAVTGRPVSWVVRWREGFEMAVDDPEMIDIVTTVRATGEVVLIITDHLRWSDEDHLEVLQAQDQQLFGVYRERTTRGGVSERQVRRAGPDRSSVPSIVRRRRGLRFLGLAREAVQAAEDGVLLGVAARKQTKPGALQLDGGGHVELSSYTSPGRLVRHTPNFARRLPKWPWSRFVAPTRVTPIARTSINFSKVRHRPPPSPELHDGLCSALTQVFHGGPGLRVAGAFVFTQRLARTSPQI